MFSVALLLACVAASSAHAVLPLAHSVHSPVVTAVVPTANLGYGHSLGYGGHGLGYGGHGLGYGGHGLSYGGHGLGSGGFGLAGYGGLGHHVLKRSPHYISSVGHLGVGHLSGLGHIGGISHLGGIHVPATAVSHQSRVDVHHSPAVVAAAVLPVVKPVVAPVLAAPLAYGAGYLGAGHLGAGHLGAGHLGAGHYGAGHYAAGHYGATHFGHY